MYNYWTEVTQPLNYQPFQVAMPSDASRSWEWLQLLHSSNHTSGYVISHLTHPFLCSIFYSDQIGKFQLHHCTIVSTAYTEQPMLLGCIPLITRILAAICSCIFVIVPEQDTRSLNSNFIWVTRTVLKIHVLLEAVWIGDEFQRNSGLAIFTQGCAKNQIQFSVLRTKFNSPESFPSSH